MEEDELKKKDIQFVTSYFAWTTPEEQKEIVDKLEKITEDKNHKKK